VGFSPSSFKGFCSFCFLQRLRVRNKKQTNPKALLCFPVSPRAATPPCNYVGFSPLRLFWNCVACDLVGFSPSACRDFFLRLWFVSLSRTQPCERVSFRVHDLSVAMNSYNSSCHLFWMFEPSLPPFVSRFGAARALLVGQHLVRVTVNPYALRLSM
jgi:hypothetical protein